MIRVPIPLVALLLLAASAAHASPPPPEEPPEAAGDPPQPSAVRRLTLEGAINRALAANRPLADAVERVESIRLSRDVAEAEFELKVIPAASVGSGGGEGGGTSYGAGLILSRKVAAGAVLSVEPSLRREGELWRGGVDARLAQPLLRGLGSEANLDPLLDAEFSGRTTRRALHLRRVETILETVAALYLAVEQREVLRVGEESAARLRGHAEAARIKERVGIADPIDAYRAALQLKSAEDALATAREAFRDALDSLKLILALPLGEALEIDVPLGYDLVSLTEEEAVAAALRNRVEIDQAEDAFRESERRSRLAGHRTLPELNLLLSYSRFGEGSGAADGAGFDRNAWAVGLETSTALGRTAERAAHRQSLIAVRSAQRARELGRDELARQAKRGYRSLRRAEARIAIQRERIRQAEGQMELAKVKFRHGQANNFDVIEAETTLRQSETALLAAVSEYIVGTWRLRGAMGTLVQRPERF